MTLPILSGDKPADIPASDRRQPDGSILSRDPSPRCTDCAYRVDGSRVIRDTPVPYAMPSGISVCHALGGIDCMTARRGTKCGPSGILYVKQTIPALLDGDPSPGASTPKDEAPSAAVKTPRKHRRVKPLPAPPDGKIPPVSSVPCQFIDDAVDDSSAAAPSPGDN